MKHLKSVLLITIAAVLVGMYGCTTQKDPDTTENSEVKATESTTVLTEETEVIETTETTETTEKAAFDGERFEVFDDYIYRYTGGHGSVTFEDYGLTVQLPEAWIGRVEILCSNLSEMHIYLANIELMDAYAEYRGTAACAWQDYILHVFSAPKDNEAYIEEIERDEHVVFLSENEKYRFYYTTASNMNTDCNTFLTIRYSLIQDKGQEYYDSLVGDLICTDEMVKEIIKVSEIS